MAGQVVPITATSSPAVFAGLPAGSTQQFRVTAQGPGGSSQPTALSGSLIIPAGASSTPVQPAAGAVEHASWPGGPSGQKTFAQTMSGNTSLTRWWGRDYMPHDITQIGNPGGTIDQYASAGFPGLLMGTPLAGPSTTCAQVASGAVDSQVVAYAKYFEGKFPNGRGVVMLGWEPNIGGQYPWSVGASGASAAQYAAAFTRVSGLIHANSHLLVAFVPSGQSGAPGASMPGNDAIDIYGLDAYDHDYGRSGDSPATLWQRVLNGQSSSQIALAAVVNWAKTNGKKWGVYEWGVEPTSADGGGGGGDDPYYITQMINLASTGNADTITTNYPAHSIAYYSGSYNLLGGSFPKSVAAYQAAYKAQVAAGSAVVTVPVQAKLPGYDQATYDTNPSIYV